MRKPSLAFVVQRAGEEVVGGGELLCLHVAQHLRPYADIEVLTTCARDRVTWRNHYPPGHARVNDVHVQRFAVDAPRNSKSFSEASRRLRNGASPALREQEAWMRAAGPSSTALHDYVRRHEQRFDRFGFFGYLFASTYFTLPLVQEKAVLWPLAHDEWPLGLSMWNAFFQRPTQLVFSTVAEQQLLARRFPSLTTGQLVATGVFAPPVADAVRFRNRYDVNGSFVLYLRRSGEEKGAQILFDYFAKYRSTATMPRKLVIIGDGPLDVPLDAGIIALGRVGERSTWDALAATDLVVVPLPSRSSAPAVLEAWAAGKPVLVDAASPELVAQCRRANGGLWFSNDGEFAAALDLLTPELASRLGAQGRRFVETEFVWEEAVNAYRRILGC